MATSHHSERVRDCWMALRATRPLVQNITNFVAMNWTANVLLAAGASPAMVHAPEELEDFAQIASALSVNIGTLTPAWVESMVQAASHFNALGKPWVLDPVGSGATRFRTETAKRLLSLRPTVLRGNASEIISLCPPSNVDGEVNQDGASSHPTATTTTTRTTAATRGVDSAHSSSAAVISAERIARVYGVVVVVTGEHDYITDGKLTLCGANGHEMATKVTAAGCSLSSLVAGYVCSPSSSSSSSSSTSSFSSGSSPSSSEMVWRAAAAVTVFGIASEIAFARAFEQSQSTAAAAAAGGVGPGTFAVQLLDSLHTLDENDILQRARLDIVSQSAN